MTEEKQIKSRDRVREQGEVFTAEREVNAMLDLVKQETERIDSRFLEPACGNGNFLVQILKRKLDVVCMRYMRQVEDINLHATIALSSIYGIDIMQDNVEECRERLYEIIKEWYPHACITQGRVPEELEKTWRYILKRNILWGDALTLCTPDEEKKPIIFSEWSFIGQSVKRKDYTLDMLLRPRNFEGPSLFDELGDEVFIPEPCKEYSLVNYNKLYRQDAVTD